MNVFYLYNAYTKIGEENDTNPNGDYLSCLFFTTSSSSRSFFLILISMMTVFT